MATFGSANFFTAIEPQVNSGGRMCHGQDGNVHYVVLDPLFHPMKVFERNISRTFTDDITQSKSTNDKVFINGQFFTESRLDYCYNGPCDCKTLGEAIVDGLPKPGKPATVSYYNFVGREKSIPLWRYKVGKGTPSANPKLYQALGSVTALIEGKIFYGYKELTIGGKVVQKKNDRVTPFFLYPTDCGKSAICFHRSSGLIMIVGQKDKVIGTDWQSLIVKLWKMGIDDAVYLDGSSSSVLWVDGSFAYTPSSGIKNQSIPNGLRFTRTPLLMKSFVTPKGTSGVSEWVVTQGSTSLPAQTHITGLVAKMEPASTQGLTLTITDFGQTTNLATNLGSADIAAVLNAGSAPYTFKSTTGNLGVLVPFTRSGSPLNIQLKVTETQGSDLDTLQGVFSTTSPSNSPLSGTLSLPIFF